MRHTLTTGMHVLLSAAAATLVAGCDQGTVMRLVMEDIAKDAEPAHVPVRVAAGEAYDATIAGRDVLTPPPPPAPRIHGPELYGVRPGMPVIYRIPTTGTRPIQFAAGNLPASMKLDAARGILTGRAPDKPGTYKITLQARSPHGKDSASLELVVGNKLALTPPMGWNHWYTHYSFVTGKIIRDAADAMVASGMADVGYAYVSIDDCWMRVPEDYMEEVLKRAARFLGRKFDVEAKKGPTRDESGVILPARDFADMKGLADHVHSYGLKAGIYTSPGPRTCARFEGAFGHEKQDAQTFAGWGFDLLKYDWCSYGEIYGERMKAVNKDPNRKLPENIRPYAEMCHILADLDRDIVLNLCQYGMAEVWKWGGQIGGQSWRIGGDIGIGFTMDNVFRTAKKTLDIGRFNGPSHWNDPDYLILGNWSLPGGKAGVAGLEPVNLPPAGQYSYVSLWCLMACPLFFSGDMATVDDFTRSLLCNTEMIAINQDRLGTCATAAVMDDNQWVLTKPLADGSVAVGLFNLDKGGDREIAVTWKQLGLDGPPASVRDLWRQEYVAFAGDGMKVKLSPTGCAVFKLAGKPASGSR